MAVVAVGWHEDALERAAHPRGSLPWIVGTVILIATVCFVGYGVPRLWGIHASDRSLRPTLETGIAAAAITGAILLVARFRQTRLHSDLLLLGGLGAVALTDFIFNALPAYGYRTAATYGGGFWMALTTLAAGAFAAAAFSIEDRQVTITWRTTVTAATAIVGWFALWEAIDAASGLVTNRGPVGIYAPIWNATALLCFALLLLSGLRFAHRGGSEDPTARLLTGVAVLLAGAELGTLAMPVVPRDWLMPGDALRAGAFAILIVVSVILYRRSLHDLAHEALTAERSRIAHDLHDSLAQDLALIAAHSGKLARDFGADHPLTVAARRALAASRGKILDLEASHAPTTAAALREVAAEAGARFDVSIDVRVRSADQPEPSPAERTELVRIAREAIANAARHGEAEHITVTLGSRREPVLLRVSDDGRGLPGPGQLGSSAGGTGLGMRAMGARARRIDAQLRVCGECEQGGAEIEIVGAAIPAGSELEPSLAQ
jgi:signal transduction histidine kinase